MDPANASQASSISLKPPKFSLNNKLQFREDVQRWLALTATLARAGHKDARTTCVTLAETLIATLPHEQRELVRASISNGEIRMTKTSFKAQVKAVKKIVQVIASDTPTEHVERVASAYQAVSTCHRGKKESPATFATRFYARAKTYLRIAGSSEDEAAGMLLAQIFVENANLSNDTKAHVKLSLQQGAALSHPRNEDSDSGSSGSEDADFSSESEPDDPTETDEQGNTMTHTQRARARRERRIARRKARKAKLFVSPSLFEDNRRVHFSLQDVYKAILVVPTQKSDPGPEVSMIDAAVSKALMTRLGPEKDDDKPKERTPSLSQRKGKKRPRCTHCGRTGHVEDVCF